MIPQQAVELFHDVELFSWTVLCGLAGLWPFLGTGGIIAGFVGIGTVIRRTLLR